MITKVDNIQSVGIGFKYPTEFFGLSTDTKPTDTANGSVFTEIDSGKKYMFDFAGSQWCEIPAAESGGGGGSSGGGVLVVSADPGTMTLDKTWQEIHDADLAIIKIDSGTDQLNMPVVACDVVAETDYMLVATSVTTSGDTLVPYYVTFVATSADGYPTAQMG